MLRSIIRLEEGPPSAVASQIWIGKSIFPLSGATLLYPRKSAFLVQGYFPPMNRVGPTAEVRIGKSIHFPQVADLRSRHCKRTLGMAESRRKVVYRQQITVFDLAEEYERTS